MRRCAWALLPLLMLGLVACDKEATSGYVVKKVYDDEDNWQYQQADYCPIPMSDGRGGMYFMYITCGYHTEYGHDPAHWEFRIKDDTDPKGKDFDWVEIDQQTYDKFEPGMHWPDPK